MQFLFFQFQDVFVLTTRISAIMWTFSLGNRERQRRMSEDHRHNVRSLHRIPWVRKTRQVGIGAQTSPPSRMIQSLHHYNSCPTRASVRSENGNRDISPDILGHTPLENAGKMETSRAWLSCYSPIKGTKPFSSLIARQKGLQNNSGPML